MAEYWREDEEEEDWEGGQEDWEGGQDDWEGGEDEEMEDEPQRRTYEPEPSADEIKEIILDIMEESGVKKDQIPNEQFSTDKKHSKRYFETKAFAWFRCPKKHNRWASAHAWCCLDLKKQEIANRYTQRCRKNCEMPVDPEFPYDCIERMASYAVKEFLIRTKRRFRSPKRQEEDDEEVRNSKPHDEHRCAMCQKLGRSCWKK